MIAFRSAFVLKNRIGDPVQHAHAIVAKKVINGIPSLLAFAWDTTGLCFLSENPLESAFRKVKGLKAGPVTSPTQSTMTIPSLVF